MGGKVKLPPELADLLRSDLERAIYEAALHRDDDLIARRCIIEKSAQVDRKHPSAYNTPHKIS